MPATEDDPRLEKLTFEGAVDRALTRNPTSLQAAAAVRRSRALLEQVRSASLPTLTGAGVYTRLDSNRVAGGLVLDRRKRAEPFGSALFSAHQCA
jgi:outer membrane protein TolC